MSKSRLEAFSDGVLAIIITLMVLTMQPPNSPQWDAIIQIGPAFVTYVLSYVFIGIYWNNHHHLLSALHGVTWHILWANLHWLFWMSLMPLMTAWMDRFPFTKGPTVFFGIILFMCAITYHRLQTVILQVEGLHLTWKQSLRDGRKSVLTIVGYLLSILVSLFHPVLGLILYWALTLSWIVPDRKMKQRLQEARSQ